ncbi:MAG: hypothetical protein A2Y64_04915 [Candidatus Coatesbacteria bacterium RBG_13_66_14]|uniref:SbsA Ig-like domain-containing protein n=1 Tax=Candidatus Coatesbacteria bacterium RBG_13_66_14 TaxID=1817816 RepID=A0A1F5F6G5_9BACT|nr:MAG: hypothetical protein A2Y64_04915 [Candidatus Coatesbacteria bacterium RBG_13_66_14]
MKKIILTALMLALIFSVAWANRITLSADSEGRIVVTDGDSGAIPVPPLGEHNTGEDGEGELLWDDGVMDEYWEDGYNRAVQFIAPVDCHLITGLVYQEDDGILYTPYYFAVYGDADGVPGEELGGVMAVGDAHNGWDEINLISVGIALTEGDVFYGAVIKNGGEFPYLCADTTEPIHGNFYNEPSQMEWVFDETSNLMLRVVVDDDVAGPYTENPNPAPGDSGVHGDVTLSFEIHDENHSVTRDSIIVMVAGQIVTDKCTISQASMDGSFLVTFKPEKEFIPGDVYVFWYAEDELGNGDDDTWYFTVDEFSDDSATEDTSWGVIKEKF